MGEGVLDSTIYPLPHLNHRENGALCGVSVVGSGGITRMRIQGDSPLLFVLRERMKEWWNDIKWGIVLVSFVVIVYLLIITMRS